jgi:hypothetical protein
LPDPTYWGKGDSVNQQIENLIVNTMRGILNGLDRHEVEPQEASSRLRAGLKLLQSEENLTSPEVRELVSVLLGTE